MSIIEQLEARVYVIPLKQGTKARIKHTGQVVNLKRVSDHGISMVSFHTGGDYLISNKFLEPVFSIH
ncbi:MAG: hypothetical protein GQ549_01460 [Gammaproteobacteria bacterium]|nr:hypothetical protein [Gammaproteobacteria bacterium]